MCSPLCWGVKWYKWAHIARSAAILNAPISGQASFFHGIISSIHIYTSIRWKPIHKGVNSTILCLEFLIVEPFCSSIQKVIFLCLSLSKISLSTSTTLCTYISTFYKHTYIYLSPCTYRHTEYIYIYICLTRLRILSLSVCVSLCHARSALNFIASLLPANRSYARNENRFATAHLSVILYLFFSRFHSNISLHIYVRTYISINVHPCVCIHVYI